jgi:DNA invertase Pin-like site-specific DNA recombinase
VTPAAPKSSPAREEGETNIATSPDTKIPTVHVGIESGRSGAESPESQLRAIAKHPDATEGRVCVGTFKESGKTGFKGERGPELEAAIRAAKAAAAEHGEAELWCFHTSRLARGSGRKGSRSFTLLQAQLLYEDVIVRSVSDDEFATNPMLVSIASVQNHKYSADLAAHVKRGKDEQRANGERPGGPLNDGYIMRVLERDAKGKVTRREFDFDPTRRETIARMFDLLLQAIPDAQVGRMLNAEGHRTAKGGYWDRRTVGDKARNAWYAGAVVWYRETPAEEIIWNPPTPHPTYISRKDFDRLAAMRRTRDKGKGSNRKPGRPNERHLLADLAECDRCGGKMRATTASYRRKDGSKGYSYICENVKAANGMCDAPVVNGEVADLEVAAYLRDLFADGGGQFLQRVGIQRDTEREGVEASLEREGKRRDRLAPTVAKLQRRYRDLVAADDDARAAAVEGALTETREEVEQVEHRIGELESILAAAPDPADAVLDVYEIVKRRVTDSLGRSAVPDIRAGLAESFERFTLGRVAEGVKVRAYLRVGEVVGVKRLSPAPAEPVGNVSDSQL